MKKRLLMIEDDPQLTLMIEQYLENDPQWEFLYAYSAEEGLKKLNEARPDVLVCDINLGEEITGVDICQRVKKDPALKHIPFILLTGLRTAAEDKVKGLNIGADDYLVKPIRIEILLAKCERLVKFSVLTRRQQAKVEEEE